MQAIAILGLTGALVSALFTPEIARSWRRRQAMRDRRRDDAIRRRMREGLGAGS